MVKRLLTLLAILFFCLHSFAQDVKTDKMELKILYVGGSSDWSDGNIATLQHPDSVASRSGAFKELLEKYFTSVTLINGADYDYKLSEKYDVTIIDGKIPQLRDRIHIRGKSYKYSEYYRPIYFPQDYSAPTLFLAEAASLYGEGLGSKSDWYCLCLAGEAYNMDLSHPIFNTPFKVTPTTVEKDIPDAAKSYQYYFYEPIPQKVNMWRVQSLDYENNKDFRVGMVSRPWGIEDSPEGEIISGGVSAKSHDAASITRHGSFFHWGFSASPKYMTDEAKLVFVNAVTYTASLKGQRIIARKYDVIVRNKELLAPVINGVTDESYAAHIRMLKDNDEQMKAYIETLKERQAKGEELSQREKMYMNMPVETKIPTKEEYLKEKMGKYYDTFNGNVKAYRNFWIKNTPYIAYDGEKLEVDTNMQLLKLDNTKLESLDKLISMYEKGKNVDMVKRALDRYTLCTFETPQQWRNWFDTNKERLFFSQSGGWKWLLDSYDADEPTNDYDAKPIYAAAKSIVLTSTDDNEPVAVGATITKLPYGRMAVVVKMKIHDGYHIYSPLVESGAFTPTSVEVKLPEGYYSEPLKYPATVVSSSGTPEYVGEIVFSQEIIGTGGDKIDITVKYQCCNPNICLPPAEKNFELVPLYK
ncbi:MAG: hypothetical protein IJA38_02245 [Bacteroidales bacterium]|nr:hypothetical protein [Bacteroidales bacterium]